MNKDLLRYTLCSILLLMFSVTRVAARPVSASKSIRREAFFIKPKVDTRVELMSIISRLAGYGEYVHNDFKLYASDVDRHYEKYKQHPAVLFAVKIRNNNSIGFDAVMKMAVHLSPPPELRPRVAFTSQVPEGRWGNGTAEEFVKMLQHFYKDADCENFFKSHADLYRTAEQRFQQVLGKVNLGWYTRFYGEAPKGTFHLYIGLLNGGANYGPKVVHADGKEDLYAIIGTSQVDSEGLPLYDQGIVPIIIHEFNHSFINHLVNERKQQLSIAGERVYQPVADEMRSLAYGDWEVAIIESLVRAAVVRYLLENEAQPEIVYQELLRERNNGFLWIEELAALLGTYENSRSLYPTLRSFFPLIEGYYKDLAKRIDSVD